MRKLALYVCSLLLFPFMLWAQDVQVSLQAPNVVEIGEQFQLTISVNNSPSSFEAPLFPSEIEILMGPSTSRSSSMQIINGNVSQTTSTSYTYVATIRKAGKYNIPPAKATVKSKVYSSKPFSIEAIGSIQTTSSSASSPQSQSSSQTSQDVQVGGNLFAKLILSNKNVYVGQPIKATLKIYSKINLIGFDKINYPDFKGFYKEDIKTPALEALVRENVNGEIYGTGVIQEWTIIPEYGGKLTVNPVDLTCIVRQTVQRKSRSVWDDFFSNGYQDVKVDIKSIPLTVNVKKLPDGAPANFKGAVGNYSMNASLNKSVAKTNDAISLKVTISGSGNIKLVDNPAINFPSDFEIYDPQVSVNSSVSESGINGSKTFEYLFIPRHPGEYTIPAIEYCYFNANEGEYKCIKSKEFKLTIERGEGITETAEANTGIVKEEVQYLGTDIRYISASPINFKSTLFFKSLLFYLLIAFPLIVFIIALVLLRTKIKESADLAKVKNKKARSLAVKRLALAKKNMEKNQEALFFEEVVKAVWGYLSDKLSISTADINREIVRKNLTEKGIEHELTEALLIVIEQCEYARYAPDAEKLQMPAIYEQAIQLIISIENKMKR